MKYIIYIANIHFQLVNESSTETESVKGLWSNRILNNKLDKHY